MPRLRWHLCGLGADADSDPRPGPVPVSSCLARSMPAWDSVQRFLFVLQLPLAKMFVACPGPRWPAATPCGLPARGRECRAGRLRVQRHAVLQAVGRGLTQLLQLVAVSVIGREIVLKGLLPRLLPLWFATDAINLSGKRLRKQARVQRAQGRPEMRYIRDFIESPGPAVRQSPAFLVVSGPQGVGKSIMLNTIFADYAAEGRHVLLMTQNLLPGQSLDLETILRKALRIDKLPVYFPNVVPEFVEELQARPFLDVVKRKPREPLIIYMQLSTQNRADDFDQNPCEAIAAAVGGFARELTYEYGLCKFVLEVDKIQERPGQNRASRVLPRCCNSGQMVVGSAT